MNAFALLEGIYPLASEHVRKLYIVDYNKQYIVFIYCFVAG